MILERPLCSLDTETTGLWPEYDRVVEIAVDKLYPDGKRVTWRTLVNPGCPIPQEASAVHGITDEMVATAPRFGEIAKTLRDGTRDCDLTGYNINYDLRMLLAEYRRAGLSLEGVLDGRVIDVLDVTRRHHKLDLSFSVRHYLQREHEGAHGALADARAALDVLLAQVATHGLPSSVPELYALLYDTPQKPTDVDPAGKFIWRNGEVYCNFGTKTTGVRLRDIERSFLQWMCRSDFPAKTKKIAEDALNGIYPVRES